MRTSSDHLSATFSALADPTRRAILSSLAVRGETSVTDLARPFEMSLPGFSKHLKVLEKAGLIARGRNAQWRPCKLEAEPLREVADWVEHYRRHWEQSFDRLEIYLKELQAGEGEKMKTAAPATRKKAVAKKSVAKKKALTGKRNRRKKNER